MDKNKAKTLFGEQASEEFYNQLAKNDRNCGTSAQLNEGMRITLRKLDYFDGHRTIGKDEYDNNVESTQKHRYVDNGDGTFTVDNSYYGVLCEGAVTAVSFRTLTSAAQAPDLFPDGCLIIPAGRASEVAKGIMPYLNRTLEVAHVEKWEKGAEWNTRKQNYAGRAVGFKLVEQPTETAETTDEKKGKK